MAKNIMFQRTGLTVGKSVITAAQEEAYDYLAKRVKTKLDINQIKAIVGIE